MNSNNVRPNRQTQPSGQQPRRISANGHPVNADSSRQRSTAQNTNRSAVSRSQTNRQSVKTSSGKRSLPSSKKKKNTQQNSKKAPFKYEYERTSRHSEAGSTVVTSLIKAIIYIVTILVVSGVLGYFAISISNEAFAFIKSGEDMTVTVTEKLGISSLGNFLGDNGLIKYEKIFNIYAKLRYGSEMTFDAGEYNVSSAMSYDEMISVFAKSQKVDRTTVIVVIPEGYTVDQIISTVVDKYGLSSKEEMIDAIENYDFDYWFVKELTKDKVREGRKYRLEGYLYPDTYYYYSDAKASTILYKMLDNFDKKMKQVFGKEYETTTAEICKKENMTFDDMIIIASMVQMEAKFEEDHPGISEVFHNRLKNTSVTNGKLESDATIQYILEKRTADLTKEHLSIDNRYNTYLYPGLPPGPITNPTFATIHFAFYPNNDGNYYFLTDSVGYAHFAKNYTEHQKNIAEYIAKK